MNGWHKILGGLLVLVSVFVMVGMILAFPKSRPAVQQYGVTFIHSQAEYLGLDWQEVYQAILEDLGVRRLRLVAYWSDIEPDDDGYDWSALDFQMDQAAEHQAAVILSIGRKLPRWPECHVPEWAQGLSERDQQAKVLAMLAVVVDRYKSHPALRMWQLENEPLLDYGICPPEDVEFLRLEEAQVRGHDGTHPILITDSGELNSWLGAAEFGDVLGTTMYRTVFSKRTQSLFFYDYIFPSWGYRLKARYVKLLRGKDVLISELQGEPWGAKPFVDMTKEERRESISLERFQELKDFAVRTQLPEAYWWGVEYWYWEREVNGYDSFWETAKTFFAQSPK